MDKKKLSAIMSAVSNYIKSNEEALAAQQMLLSKERKPKNMVWAVSGRQSMMQMADLMQMKAFHVKLR